jgi:hypothetical protein
MEELIINCQVEKSGNGCDKANNFNLNNGNIFPWVKA